MLYALQYIWYGGEKIVKVWRVIEDMINPEKSEMSYNIYRACPIRI